MLRVVCWKCVYQSRSVVNRSRFGAILKCDYSNQPVKKPLERSLRSMKMSPKAGNGLTEILNRIQNEKLSSQEALNVLEHCASHPALMEEIWVALRAKATLEVAHYNLLLEVYVDKEMHFEPVKVLEEMLTANIEPNRKSFDHFTRALAMQGDVDGVLKMLEETENKGMTIDDFQYNNLILAYANDGKVEQMHDAANLMQQKGFALQADTLNAFLIGYAKTGDIEGLNRAFDRFRALKIVPRNKDVLEVIVELHANNHDQLIERVAHRLSKSNEMRASLKPIVEKAVRRKVDTVVPKLLSIFDEADRLILAKVYVEALREVPANHIDNAVKMLGNYGITLQTHPSVFNAGLESNSSQLIRAILDDMKARSVPIESSHFWQLIELESSNGTEAVLDVVQSMIKDFNIEPDVHTIRDSILPCMNMTADPYLQIAHLLTVYSNTPIIVRSLFERYLFDNNMKAAHEVANDASFYVCDVDSLQNSLVTAFLATGDVQRFVKIVDILRFRGFNSQKNARPTANPETSSSNSSDAEPSHVAPSLSTRTFSIENIVLEMIARIRANPQQIESVLQAFVSFRLLSSDALQKMIEIVEEKGEDASALKRSQFRAYFKEKKFAKAIEMAKVCNLSDCDHRRVILMHLQMDSTADALNYWKHIHKSNPDFSLQTFHAVRLAHAMLKAKYEWNEIIQIFTENKQPQPPTKLNGEIHNFLRAVIDMGDGAQIEEMLTTFRENNFVADGNCRAEFLIKVHSMNKDLSEVLQIFEQQVEQENSTAGSVELMKLFIKADDEAKLETVFDIVIWKHSEAIAVLQLTESFIETGNIGKARLVMQNNSHKNLYLPFRKQCNHYYNWNKPSVMEGLIEATEGMKYKRRVIYYYLLLYYCMQNEIQKALSLWRRQLHEKETPSLKFLRVLASHLTLNGIEVPFQMPTTIEVADADAALQEWTKSNLNSVQYALMGSHLVRLLTINGREMEAVEVAINTGKSGHNVSKASLEYLAHRLAAKGDIQSLDRLNDSFSHETKKSIRLGSICMQAYQNNGKWNDFFAKILGQVEAAQTIQTNRLMLEPYHKFEMTLLQLLQNQSISLDEFKDFACIAADRGFYNPLNVLWAHHVLIDSPEASEWYARWEQVCSWLICTDFMVEYLIAAKKEDKLQQLLEFVQVDNSFALQIFGSLVKQHRIRDALDLIDYGAVSVDRISKNILKTLRKSIKANGDPLPKSILPVNPNKFYS